MQDISTHRVGLNSIVVESIVELIFFFDTLFFLCYVSVVANTSRSKPDRCGMSSRLVANSRFAAENVPFHLNSKGNEIWNLLRSRTHFIHHCNCEMGECVR